MGQSFGESTRCCCSKQKDVVHVDIVESSHPSNLSSLEPELTSTVDQTLPSKCSAQALKDVLTDHGAAAGAPSEPVIHTAVSTESLESKKSVQLRDEVSLVQFDTVSSIASVQYQELVNEQQQAAKTLVKDLVKAMIVGKEFMVMFNRGQARTSLCTFSRNLDRLIVVSGIDNTSQKRRREVPFSKVVSVENIETTRLKLTLDTKDTVTMKLADTGMRDKFVLCVTMLVSNIREGKDP